MSRKYLPEHAQPALLALDFLHDSHQQVDKHPPTAHSAA
jgi:hypothetical protein